MKIVLLGKNGDSTAIVYNRLVEEGYDITTIIENPADRKKMMIRRIKRIGLIKVIGQILFKIISEPKIKREGIIRRDEILKKYNLSIDKMYESSEKYHKVDSINDDECIELLKSINPDIVIINGTRIVSEKTLNCIDASFINMHMGITPKYRGVHGGYWALIEDDRDHCGVTVHKVDTGVDTGKILYQDVIEPTNKDNLYTYQYLQAAKGVDLELKVLKDFENGGLIEMEEHEMPSKLWYHPTIWEYNRGKKKGIC